MSDTITEMEQPKDTAYNAGQKRPLSFYTIYIFNFKEFYGGEKKPLKLERLVVD